MRHWLQLATRSWRAKAGRTAAAIVAVALGVATVVCVTGFYESVRRSIADQVVNRWLGNSHLAVASPAGHWGHVDQSLASPIARLDNVAAVTCRSKRRMGFLLPSSAPGEYVRPFLVGGVRTDVDAIGIDAEREYAFRTYQTLSGRLLAPGERDGAVMEQRLARDLGLDLGDEIILEAYDGGPTGRFRLVGLFETRRVARFQQPVVLVPLTTLQEIRKESGRVTVIDIMLQDTGEASLSATAERVETIIRERKHPALVQTAAARLRQLQEAERITHLILLLVAFVALLTAFFIIVTTMSMGLIERITQWGVLRCIGLTRRQLCALVLTEVVPLGVVGVVLGVPLGFGFAWLGARVAPEYVADVVVSAWGLWLAVLGGLATTVGGALVLVIQVGRVSPMQATNPQAQPARMAWTVVAAAVGVGLLATHQLLVARLPPIHWLRPAMAFAGIGSVYGGYVLLIPALVPAAGAAAVYVIAPVLRVRRQLARDQIGRTPWRSAGVCWMLMVGLSLIVYLAVRSESFLAAWDFPSKLASAFVWTRTPVSRTAAETARRLPGVGKCTLITEVYGRIGNTRSGVMRLLQLPSVFVAGEPQVFLDMAKVEFLEGDEEDARRKLEQGGYVLLPLECARAHRLHRGDRFAFVVGNRSAEFEVAAVVKSPALEIAVTYFHTESELMLAAAGAVLGTLADARRHFRVDDITLFLLDPALPDAPIPPAFGLDRPPPGDADWLAGRLPAWLDRPLDGQHALGGWTPPAQSAPNSASAPPPPPEMARFRRAWAYVGDNWDELEPKQRWDQFRERLVLGHVAAVAGAPQAMLGSLRRLKERIQSDVRDAVLLLSAIPLVALLVAALGIANLMTANVASRARQIAIVRAVGATRAQIVRLVFAEALTLGALGCVGGAALGLHAARSMNVITSKLVGITAVWTVPWGHVLTGILVTGTVCVLAGIAPARHAARNNIIDAMRAA